jgi:hypothetical protein
MAEVMATQTELLRQLVQVQQAFQQFQQQRGGHNIHQPQAASYMDFLGTQPPLFHKMVEPLDVNVWICTIKSMFSLLVVPCSDANKARFATQQLCGTVRLWWKIISPCSQPIMLSLGRNSRMHSEPTIFQKGLWRGS